MNSLTSIFIFRNVLLSLVITLLLGWISIPLARRFGLMDFPGSAPHKQHETATPLAGGVVLLLTLLLCEYYGGLLEHPFLKATFVSVLPVFFIGLWDDFRSLSPPVKLAGQIAAAILLIRQGVYIRVFESPEFFIYGSSQIFVWLDWILTVVWLVGITNAFNLVDSMDGLAVGLGGLAAAFFMLVTIDAYQTNLAQHSALIIGVCIGLYLFNSPPAMLFLGDAGAQTLGFILGVVAIAYNPIESEPGLFMDRASPAIRCTDLRYLPGDLFPLAQQTTNYPGRARSYLPSLVEQRYRIPTGSALNAYWGINLGQPGSSHLKTTTSVRQHSLRSGLYCRCVADH